MENYGVGEPRTCHRCGTSVPATKIVQTAGFRDKHAPIPDWAVTCSPECAQQLVLKEVNSTVRCAQCPKTARKADSITEPARPGRKRVYCSDKCKRARERQLARGWRLIGKGTEGLPKSASDHDSADAWSSYHDRLKGLAADVDAATATRDRTDAAVNAAVQRIRQELSERLTAAEIHTRRKHAEERALELTAKAAAAAKAGRLDRAGRLSRAVADALAGLPELPADSDMEMEMTP
ncbi:MAG: hypothetical protein ACRDXX_17550 [Stackebrandtia sp.]